MLKNFDKDDLVKLWSLVHERFNLTEPTEDKERELWVELKRLFEPDDDNILWELQRYMHDPFKENLYTSKQTKTVKCLEVSSQYRWFNSEKLVDLNDNHKFRRGLLGIKGFYNFVLLVQLSTAMRRLSTIKLS
ncbi:hypothetical protein Tco_1562341 [Tanacetum coccineum]